MKILPHENYPLVYTAIPSFHLVPHTTPASPSCLLQGLFVEAAGFYESTLHYQPEFQPADTRLRTVRCLILAAKKHHKKAKKTKGIE